MNKTNNSTLSIPRPRDIVISRPLDAHSIHAKTKFSSSNSYDVIVIGGGPAGFMAAISASSNGAKVLLIEKNPQCGRKLLISGAGKCNISNKVPLDEFVLKFPENGKFLYPALKEFFVEDLERFCDKHGLSLKSESNGKIFPATERADSVLSALLDACIENKVSINTNETCLGVKKIDDEGMLVNYANHMNNIHVNNISGLGNKSTQQLNQNTNSNKENEILISTDSKNANIEYGMLTTVIEKDFRKCEDLTNIWSVETDVSSYLAASVIVATGGLSYPKTGSTGDGYYFANQNGIHVNSLRPGLVPFIIDDPMCKVLSGVSVKKVVIRIKEQPYGNQIKTIASLEGDLLFTHFGISGPPVLMLSRYLPSDIGISFNDTKYFADIDLLPGVKAKDIEERLLVIFSQHPSKQLKNIINKEFDIPLSLAVELMTKISVGVDATAQLITREKRKELVAKLKSLELRILSTRGYSEAMVTCGGISTKEINPKTMECKNQLGLYFCGEVLDIDGDTGGFNIQAALSTGNLAGDSAALKH